MAKSDYPVITSHVKAREDRRDTRRPLPSEEISGLEDEYHLCGDKPKLIYVKTLAPERDARLKDLLRRIQGDDNASYKPFATARELRKLLEPFLGGVLDDLLRQNRTPTLVCQ